MFKRIVLLIVLLMASVSQAEVFSTVAPSSYVINGACAHLNTVPNEEVWFCAKQEGSPPLIKHFVVISLKGETFRLLDYGQALFVLEENKKQIVLQVADVYYMPSEDGQILTQYQIEVPEIIVNSLARQAPTTFIYHMGGEERKIKIVEEFQQECALLAIYEVLVPRK